MGHVFERDNGRWYMRYDLPAGPDGKRKQKMISCGPHVKKENQAKAMLAQVEAEIALGTYIDATNMSVREYLLHWLQVRKLQGGSPLTQLKYTRACDNILIPCIGHVKLKALKPVHIQQLYSMLLEKGRADGENGLSAKSVRDIHGILRSALNQALRWQMIPTNPAGVVDPPKASRSRVRAARAGDIPLIVSAIAGSEWRIPILLVIATGMRRGEVCGLRWEDFNPDHATIAVCRSVAQVDGSVVKDTKTGNDGVVALPEEMVPILEAHRKDQEACGIDPNGWICTNKEGNYLLPNSLGRAFRRIIKPLGIQATLHGLRHTQATELLMAGIPVKAVSERMRHARTGTTEDLYGHVLPHIQKQSAEIIGSMMGLSDPKITLLEGGKSADCVQDVCKSTENQENQA